MKWRDKSLYGVRAVCFFRSVNILKSDQDEEEEEENDAGDSLIITIWNLLFMLNKKIDNIQPIVSALEEKTIVWIKDYASCIREYL